MPNPAGIKGPARPELLGRNASMRLGQESEELVIADLKRRGFKVWHLCNATGQPDLKVEGPDGVEFGIEVRTTALCAVLDPASPDYGRTWFQRRKKARDRDGIGYAWVDRLSKAIEYDPALPQYEVRRVA